MILRGRIVKMDMLKTAYPRRQEYWRVIVCPVIGGKQTRDLKYVNFHEPKARHIDTSMYHLRDAVIIKCNERRGSSGKMFIHGIKITNVSNGRNRNQWRNTYSKKTTK